MDELGRGFRRRWWLANVSGFTLGHLAFSLIGHGITGPHGDELTWAQYAAHTAGLLAAAGIIFALQRVVLRPYVVPTRRRIMVAVLLLVTGFWLAAETVGPPLDHLVSFTALGVALWIGAGGMRDGRAAWHVAGALSFIVGWLLGGVVVIAAIRARVFDPSSPSLVDHTINWVLGAAVVSIVGGYASGWPLARLFVRRPAAMEARPEG